eukprot:scaffold417_cov252-Pinguiococcus_pyrenoidosus.AAC.20
MGNQIGAAGNAMEAHKERLDAARSDVHWRIFNDLDMKDEAEMLELAHFLQILLAEPPKWRTRGWERAKLGIPVASALSGLMTDDPSRGFLIADHAPTSAPVSPPQSVDVQKNILGAESDDDVEVDPEEMRSTASTGQQALDLSAIKIAGVRI